MSSISIDDVKRLADLSALSVDDTQAEQLRDQIQDILTYVEQLNEVDIEGIEPTYQVTGLENVMRDDVIDNDGISHDELMKNVPHNQDGQIKVNKVL